MVKEHSSDLESIRRSRIMALKTTAVIAAVFVVLVAAATWIDYSTRDIFSSEIIEGESSLDEPFYVLLIGSDSRRGTALYTGKANGHAQLDEHADIITLMRIDPTTYTITLVTIPRDTVLAGTSMKINDNLLEGNPEKVVKAVESLTGAPIKYYLMINFTSYERLVNCIGGTVVDVPMTVTVPDPATAKDIVVYAGKNKLLNGAQSLVLARARKEYVEDQDALRQVNVRNLQVSIIEKASISQESLNAAWTLLEENVVTNMDRSSLASLALQFMMHKDSITIYSCSGPYEGGENEDGLWVVMEDKETWYELMEAVDAGEDPTDIVPLPRFPNS